jgi:O-antigen/teichoic acid export membrane protein
VSPASTDDTSRGALVVGEHERRLAVNYLARQASHAIAVLTGLGVTALLARRLSLSEFGTFALLLSLTSYLAIIQGIVETSAIRAFAEASDQRARDSAFSTALLVYSASGVFAAALIAGLGALLLKVWTIAPALQHEARQGVAALAAITMISWPSRVFYDTLRGSQLFKLVAAAEIIAGTLTAALLVAFLLAGAPLWSLVSVAGAGSLATGLTSALILFSRRMPHYRFTRDGVSRAGTRRFLGLSAYLSLAGSADFVIYSLDRTILGAFRPATAVGLYEGPVRAHNLVRDVQATLVSPVLPAAVQYRTEDHDRRLRDLLIRGTRYSVAIIVPLALVLMVLAKPILDVWLGGRFGTAATAMTILVGYWIVYANTSVAWTMFIAAGKVREFALFAATVAICNAALSLALTPWLGLNGLVLGTTIPYVLAFPAFLRLALPEFGVSLAELAREVWLPAYSTAIVVAAGLIALRLSVELSTAPICVAAGVGALLTYWSMYYLVWLRPSERLLMRSLARTLVAR